jgi:hypothetical protein
MLISVKVDNGPSPIIVNIIDAKSPDEARMRAYNYAYYGDQFSTEEAADQDTLEAYTSVVKPRELRDRRRIFSGSLEGNWHLSSSQGEKSMATPEEIRRIARLIKEDIDDTAPGEGIYRIRDLSDGSIFILTTFNPGKVNIPKMSIEVDQAEGDLETEAASSPDADILNTPDELREWIRYNLADSALDELPDAAWGIRPELKADVNAATPSQDSGPYHGFGPVASGMLASERANKAASEASQWHQGSGIHANGLEAACKHFEELGHTEVAELLADAAEAEALHLKNMNGEWLDYDEWQKTASGMATQKAEAAAQKIDPTFRILDWS